jgi:hypothetical protein
MSLTNEVQSIIENSHIPTKSLGVARLTEKYNSFVARGLIKEEGRKVPLPGEVNNHGLYRNRRQTEAEM